MSNITYLHKNISIVLLFYFFLLPLQRHSWSSWMSDDKYIANEYLFWGPTPVIIGLPKRSLFFAFVLLAAENKYRF